MSEGSGNVLTKVVGRVFPRMPDFFGLLNEQCDLAVEALEALVAFMESGGNTEDELRVRELEHDGDRLKARNMDVLNRAFSTPMDREELYRAISTIDHIVNYAKTTVREMDALGVRPDLYTLEMAQYLLEGMRALQSGYLNLSSNPRASESDAQAARKAERNTEKTYRRALAELFDTETKVAQLEALDGPTGPAAIVQVMEVFKKREIYRHLSNAADRVARAGEVLHDITVKLI